MSLASANVKATYDNVHGGKAGQSNRAARRNMRLKKLEAYRTVPKDQRAPAVVQKADADLAQQELEMGNVNSGPNGQTDSSSAGSATGASDGEAE